LFAMGFATLAAVACLLGVVASQGIVYNSVFCTSYGLVGTSTEWINKYKTMVTNLNKDTTLSAQKTRATNFLNNNWKNLKGIFDKNQLTLDLASAKSKLESRWRIVTYLKGLLAKIKPKLAATKFTEIRNMLWATDKAEGNNLYFAYDDWKTDALAAITNAAKKTEVNKIIMNYEIANPKFNDDKFTWMGGFGFNKCGLS
ncbi:hypothetical protein PMAYCL1PPCAC_32520, partial [Pristionchus mayeri]